jgi:hypothetical protein
MLITHGFLLVPLSMLCILLPRMYKCRIDKFVEVRTKQSPKCVISTQSSITNPFTYHLCCTVYIRMLHFICRICWAFFSVQRIPNTDDNVFRNTQNRHIQCDTKRTLRTWSVRERKKIKDLSCLQGKRARMTTLLYLYLPQNNTSGVRLSVESTMV